MGHEYFEAIHNLYKRNRLVCFPVLHSLSVFDEDYKILILALVVNLGLGTVSTRHSDTDLRLFELI